MADGRNAASGGRAPGVQLRPAGTSDGHALTRTSVEAGPYLVKAEACYLCGIKCHKNVYADVGGEPGDFRAKVDYEPLALLSSNLGIYDADDALTLIDLADELGMDSISLGGTLGYAMEWNNGTLKLRSPMDSATRTRGHQGRHRGHRPGRLPELGRGVMALSLRQNETAYAMHSKGVEYPAYLPHTNPSYPWALAGGHMSMRTYILAIVERETDLEYWVDATVNRGPRFILDDITGLCKFSMISPELEATRYGSHRSRREHRRTPRRRG